MAECWSCGAERGEAALCTSCGVIQPLHANQDDFSALGLPPKMELSRKDLDRAYRERSKTLHPDRFPKTEPQQRRWALNHTERVNQAYKRLKDRQLRGEALLQLRGDSVAKEQERTQDQALLLEMLEQQEAVEQAPDLDGLLELELQTKERQDRLLSRAAAYFDEGQGELQHAREALAEGRYVQRMLEQIRRRKEELE